MTTTQSFRLGKFYSLSAVAFLVIAGVAAYLSAGADSPDLGLLMAAVTGFTGGTAVLFFFVGFTHLNIGMKR